MAPLTLKLRRRLSFSIAICLLLVIAPGFSSVKDDAETCSSRLDDLQSAADDGKDKANDLKEKAEAFEKCQEDVRNSEFALDKTCSGPRRELIDAKAYLLSQLETVSMNVRSVEAGCGMPHEVSLDIRNWSCRNIRNHRGGVLSDELLVITCQKQHVLTEKECRACLYGGRSALPKCPGLFGCGAVPPNPEEVLRLDSGGGDPKKSASVAIPIVSRLGLKWAKGYFGSLRWHRNGTSTAKSGITDEEMTGPYDCPAATPAE